MMTMTTHTSRTHRIRTGIAAAACTALACGTLAAGALSPTPAWADQNSCEIGKTNYITSTPWTEDALGMTTVRSLANGEGIIVAVVDSGVDTNNPHLAGDAVLPGVNLAGDNVQDGRTDNYGHGTVVAGIIAARKIEGSSLMGIAPKATILPVRVYNSIDNSSSHSQGGPSPDVLADGIRYAADHGAQIINISQSTVAPSGTLQLAVQYAQAKGSLVVSSAGNRNTSSSTQDGLRYPAAWKDVLGVAAADTSFHASSDSISGEQVDILAPGESVLSTIPRGVDCVFSAESASSSYATAYASGVAALVAQRHPDENALQWLQRIEASGNRPDPDARDDNRGWGQINPYGAITITLANGMRGPGSTQYEPYTPPRTQQAQHLKVEATMHSDGTVSAVLAVVGAAAILVIITLIALRIAKDAKHSADE